MKSKVLYIILSLTCIASALQAQFNSRLGRFQVNQTKGCTGMTVNISTADCIASDNNSSCDMYYYGTDSTSINKGFTHTYTQAGTYLLTIVFGTSGSDDIEIEVYPDTPPEVELYTCGNNAISVNITDTNFSSYVINFNDGSAEVNWAPGQPMPEHVYSTSGNKTISVRGRNPGSLDNCSSNTQAVTALATLPAPAITQLQVIDNTSVQLTYNNQPNILYRVEVATNGGSSFQLFKTTYNVTSEIITNLKTEDNYYCFRLGAFDPCNNTTAYSNTICSANFDLSVQNNSNNLSWTTNTSGITNLRLSQATGGINTFTTTVTTSPYADTNIQCGTEYCYLLTTNYPNGSQSISLEKCGTAISTDPPSPVENITLIVGQPGIEIQWQPVAGFTPDVFSVFKSDNNFYNLLTTTTTQQATDDAYVPESNACYKISYDDVCGNTSPLSAEACPIRLNGGLQKDNSINLTWTPYSGWQDGVSSYFVEKYSADGQLLQSFNTGTNLSLLDDTQDLNHQSYVYIVSAVAVEPGLPEAVSNRIVIIKDPNLFYPTAFTPNGDNLNDIFNVYGQYIVSFEMSIFNRWGELMYSTTELDLGWDGYFKGNPMPEGTYTFVADITDSVGRTFKKSGSVVLLKKK